MEKVALGHHNLLNNLVVLLIFLCSSPSLFGGFLSKLAIVILIFINLYFFKVNRYIILAMFLIVSLFLTKYLVAITSDRVDLYPLVAALHLFFLITYPFGNKVYFNCVKLGVEICFYLGFLASLVSLILGKSYFLFSLANKGLPNIYAFEGFTTTPQAFASLAILILFFNLNTRSKIRNIFPLLGLLFSINRTLFLGGLLVFFYRLLVVLTPLVFLSFVFIGFFSVDTKLLTLQTLVSRIDMLVNVSSSFFSMELSNVIFGTFMSPNFEVHSAGTKYIENGFMFILYYFGLVGIMVYLISVGIFFYAAIKLTFVSKIKVVLYFILVSGIVPMLTHEFLYVSFYISLIFIINWVCFKLYNQR